MARLLVVCLALSLGGCSSDTGPAPGGAKAAPAKNTPPPKGKTPAME